MEPSRSFIPDLHAQSPAVDFIDKRADQYHPAFAVPPSKYDPAFRMYMVESRPPNWGPPLSWEMMASTRPAAWPTPAPRLPSSPDEPPPRPRPLAEPVDALKFWDTLFPLAMDQFKAEGLVEPEELIKKGLGIRDAHDWTSVFDKFELAKQAYSNVDKGFKAKFRNVYRSIADTGVQPLMNVTKLVPNVEYITPVLGIVEILLEAATTAARVRNEILSGLDDVDMIFSQVELFLELYKADQNIRNASINLISAILNAVESSMRFFLRASWKKAFSAAFKAEGYQQDIVERLTNVKSLSTILINEAENSHKYEMSNKMREILRREFRAPFSRLRCFRKKQSSSLTASPQRNQRMASNLRIPTDNTSRPPKWDHGASRRASRKPKKRQPSAIPRPESRRGAVPSSLPNPTRCSRRDP
jgi:hypothetical protein